MEVLIGLVLLVSAIVAIIKFNKPTSALAKGAEAKAQVWAEEMVAEAAIERQQNYAQFVKETTKEDGTRMEIISHDSFMKELEGK